MKLCLCGFYVLLHWSFPCLVSLAASVFFFSVPLFNQIKDAVRLKRSWAVIRVVTIKTNTSRWMKLSKDAKKSKDIIEVTMLCSFCFPSLLLTLCGFFFTAFAGSLQRCLDLCKVHVQVWGRDDCPQLCGITCISFELPCRLCRSFIAVAQLSCTQSYKKYDSITFRSSCIFQKREKKIKIVKLEQILLRFQFGKSDSSFSVHTFTVHYFQTKPHL